MTIAFLDAFIWDQDDPNLGFVATTLHAISPAHPDLRLLKKHTIMLDTFAGGPANQVGQWDMRNRTIAIRLNAELPHLVLAHEIGHVIADNEQIHVLMDMSFDPILMNVFLGRARVWSTERVGQS